MKKIFCHICKKEIDLDHDDYAHICEYTAGQFAMEAWFHRKCYNDSLNKFRVDKASEVLLKNVAILAKRANTMMDDSGVPKHIYVEQAA